MNKSFLRWGAAAIAFVILFAACSQTVDTNRFSEESREITVSAAASLQNAFREIESIYQQRTSVKVNFNFASSGVLQNQIEAGAPIDVFASAGKQQMDALAEKELIVAVTRRDFVRNNLVLIAPTSLQTEKLSFETFLENDQARIAIGNPKTVPAGAYTEQTLRHLRLWVKIQPQLILGEDVRQVLDYVARGEVEFGAVYVSDLKTVAENKVREVARAPESSHDPILYPIAVIKNSKNQEAAQEFIELVLSSKGQAILQKYGFTSVE